MKALAQLTAIAAIFTGSLAVAASLLSRLLPVVAGLALLAILARLVWFFTSR
jgi:hypothetical protein